MKLEAYVMDGHNLNIHPAPLHREWMNNTHQRHAYRCLPLNIANAFGWEILCTDGFTAEWNGGTQLVDLKVNSDFFPISASHFGHGILTFYVPCLFRTDFGVNLMAQGPTNYPKDGIAPLSGVIETDWAPYTFTMNWIFTRPGRIRFEKDEPFCHVFPVNCTQLENIRPKLCPLSTNPELKSEFDTWSASRNKFNEDLKEPGTEAREKGWQKGYYKGQVPSGDKVECEHRTKLRLKEFIK